MAAKQCRSLEEVRRQIDDVDERLVRLIGQRMSYIRQAAKFKRTEDAVKSQDRVKEVMANVERLSKINGLDPALTEKVYRVLLDYFIAQELKELKGP